MITGAGGGLGKQYALLLASRGARVVVNDIGGSVTGDGSDTEAAHAAADEIRQHGGEAVADSHSVTSPEGGAGDHRHRPGRLGTSGHRDQQRGNRARRAVRGHDRRPVRTAAGCAFEGRVLRDAAGLESDARAGIRADTQHQLGGRNPGQRRHEQLRLGQDRVDRLHPRAGRRRAPTTTSRSTPIAPIAYTRMLAHSIDGAGQPDDAAAQAVLDDLVDQYLQKLDPALVAPVVAFLTHRDCPVSGEIYTVGAGHVARFFIGRTKGFYSPGLSVEDVRDHLDEIRDEAGYTVPGGPADEMSELFATIMAD